MRQLECYVRREPTRPGQGVGTEHERRGCRLRGHCSRRERGLIRENPRLVLGEPGSQESLAQRSAITGVLAAFHGGPGCYEQRFTLRQLANDRRDVRLAELTSGAEAARPADHLEPIRAAPAEEERFDDASRGDARS